MGVSLELFSVAARFDDADELKGLGAARRDDETIFNFGTMYKIILEQIINRPMTSLIPIIIISHFDHEFVMFD